MQKRAIVLVLFVLVAVCCVATLSAQYQPTSFGLSGDKVVPPAGTDASGRCTAQVNAAGTKCTIHCDVTASDILGARINLGEPGMNGEPVFYFDSTDNMKAEVSAASLEAQFHQNTPSQASASPGSAND